jgi:hypothetical protein
MGPIWTTGPHYVPILAQYGSIWAHVGHLGPYGSVMGPSPSKRVTTITCPIMGPIMGPFGPAMGPRIVNRVTTMTCSIWAHKGPHYGPIWAHTRPFGPIVGPSIVKRVNTIMCPIWVHDVPQYGPFWDPVWALLKFRYVYAYAPSSNAQVCDDHVNGCGRSEAGSNPGSLRRHVVAMLLAMRV